jgi:glycosyltransferase involved in cell wall biosynthesis
MSQGLSVLILTLDEEHNLQPCLQTLGWCDDVVVLDSGSSDATAEIARQAGARVFERPFDSFAGQRNHAMEEIPFAHDWVFHLDADERFTEALRAACVEAIGKDRHSAFFVPAKVIFMGRWLRFSSLYPSYQVRLVKKGEVRFRQVGHGQQEEAAERGVGYVHEPYLHEPLSKGIVDWFQRHNHYSTHEAEEILLQTDGGGLDVAGLLAFSDPARRRRALKALAARMPMRPLLRFLYMYGLRLGFLDGRAGFRYCRLHAIYERMIVLKLRELRQCQESGAR